MIRTNRFFGGITETRFYNLHKRPNVLRLILPPHWNMILSFYWNSTKLVYYRHHRKPAVIIPMKSPYLLIFPEVCLVSHFTWSQLLGSWLCHLLSWSERGCQIKYIWFIKSSSWVYLYCCLIHIISTTFFRNTETPNITTPLIKSTNFPTHPWLSPQQQFYLVIRGIIMIIIDTSDVEYPSD